MSMFTRPFSNHWEVPLEDFQAVKFEWTNLAVTETQPGNAYDQIRGTWIEAEKNDISPAKNSDSIQ